MAEARVPGTEYRPRPGIQRPYLAVAFQSKDPTVADAHAQEGTGEIPSPHSLSGDLVHHEQGVSAPFGLGNQNDESLVDDGANSKVSRARGLFRPESFS
jgi:hypothetical protein